MNFNVYINKKTGERISKVAKSFHRSRNSIITEALEEWLNNHTQSQWPKNFFDFTPTEDIPDFKAFRKEFKELPEDPLA
jgi:hypothetical protein